MSPRGKGRPRRFRWVEFKDLENGSSPQTLFLKYASVNNSSLARLKSDGCPQCGKADFRLRHDEKFDNIRFYCQSCKYETSFRIKRPTKSELRTIFIYDSRGILVGEKSADDFHEKTRREIADVAVAKSEQHMDLGGEWFDGTSGTHMQNRHLTRGELMKLIEKKKMRMQMEATLDEIEREQEDDRMAAFEADVFSDGAET